LNPIEPGETRKFGLAVLIFSAAFCGLGIWTGRVLPAVLFGPLALLGAVFAVYPKPMQPVHAKWLEDVAGRCVTVCLLVLAYYLVITPAGLLKRVFGGRPLPLAPDRDADTYWVTRTEPAQPVERFKKRY